MRKQSGISVEESKATGLMPAWMPWLVCSAVLLLAGFGLHAQPAAGGRKVVRDKAGACQMTVPADWVADKLISSFQQSADGKANAVAHGLRQGQSFAEATQMAKMVMPPSKSIEDSSKRVWYAYAGASAPQGGADWYVAVAGTPICTAQISFKNAAMEETARKIALSLTQAK